MKRSLHCALLVPVVIAALTGCSRESTRDEPAHASPAHRHEHVPPHGGTVVVLGDEAFHLEFVLDAHVGRLTAYVLDGEMENFVRISASGFEVVARPDSNPRPLDLVAVDSPATGETVGNTSQFEVQADWLKTTAEFNAVLTAISIRGTTYSNVSFNFPKGNDTD